MSDPLADELVLKVDGGSGNISQNLDKFVSACIGRLAEADKPSLESVWEQLENHPENTFKR